MRKALTWLAGLAGIAALLRRRSRQRGATPQSLPSGAGDVGSADVGDPAVELRQKLDETRTTSPSDAEAPPSLDERRARVHERATEAISQMRDPQDDPAGD